MVKGLGIDLLENARLEEALAKNAENFEQKVFTESELAQCAGRRDGVQALAARFAAKEACLKALGTGWSEGLSFRQVEVVRLDNGKPELRLHGATAERAKSLGVERVHVSLTHQPGAAAAVVVVSGEVCRQASVALGSVAPTPFVAAEVGAFLAGKRLDAGVLEEAGELDRGEIEP